MRQLLCLFSHKLTDQQIQDAKDSLGIESTNILYLPESLQKKWSQVSPQLESVKLYCRDFEAWIEAHAQNEDVVLIQGDYGVTKRMIDFCNRYISQEAWEDQEHFQIYPVYATTERKSVEKVQEDGTVAVERVFQHVRFRHYE